MNAIHKTGCSPLVNKLNNIVGPSEQLTLRVFPQLNLSLIAKYDNRRFRFRFCNTFSLLTINTPAKPFLWYLKEGA